MKCLITKSLAARKWEHEPASTEANSAKMAEIAHGIATCKQKPFRAPPLEILFISANGLHRVSAQELFLQMLKETNLALCREAHTYFF